jgi:hypothetical protein
MKLKVSPYILKNIIQNQVIPPIPNIFKIPNENTNNNNLKSNIPIPNENTNNNNFKSNIPIPNVNIQLYDLLNIYFLYYKNSLDILKNNNCKSLQIQDLLNYPYTKQIWANISVLTNYYDPIFKNISMTPDNQIIVDKFMNNLGNLFTSARYDSIVDYPMSLIQMMQFYLDHPSIVDNCLKTSKFCYYS